MSVAIKKAKLRMHRLQKINIDDSKPVLDGALGGREIDGVEHCFALCRCGFEGEVFNFNNYGGVKHLQSIWEAHVSVKPKVIRKE